MKNICTKYNKLVLLLTGMLTCFSAAAPPVEAIVQQDLHYKYPHKATILSYSCIY